MGNRQNTGMDYRSLAGMSSKQDHTGVGSKKSAGSGRSRHSEKEGKTREEEELQELDEQLLKVQEGPDNSPAYVAEAYERAQRRQGDTFLTEEDIGTDISVTEAKKLKEIQHKELKSMDKRLVQLQECQVLLDNKAKLTEKRRQIKVLLWKQKIQEKEIELQGHEEILELKKREALLDQKRAEVGEKFERLEKEGKLRSPPAEEVDSITKTRQWLQKGTESVRALLLVQDLDREVDSRYRAREGARGLSVTWEVRQCRPHTKDDVLITGSQKHNADLEKQLRHVQEQLRGNTSKQEGLGKLERLGLLPSSEGKHDRITGGRNDGRSTEELELELSKLKYLVDCGVLQEKHKLKSGKFAKTNIDIKKQEQWPHLNVLRKYAKKCTFDNIDFELFVAGETQIIVNMKESVNKEGRLRLFSRLAHWLCRCRDWVLVRGLYKAIIESVEIGEAEWMDSFEHYENMITLQQTVEHRREYEPRDRKPEVYWCKAYQWGSCTEKTPHMAQIKQDEPPLPVLHICTLCLQRENHREEHPEVECPAKK